MIKNIKKLIALLKQEDVDEIEVRRFFTTVRVSRNRASSEKRYVEEIVPEERGYVEKGEGSGKDAEAAGISKEEESEGEKIEGGKDNGLVEVSSPMVGTFYRQSDPESDPFVEVGKKVEVGETLCIIEAMKLMNEIESDVEGVVKEILVRDAQPVEYGQPLFLIDPA